MISPANRPISVKRKRAVAPHLYVKTVLSAAALAVAFFMPAPATRRPHPAPTPIAAPPTAVALPPGGVDMVNPQSALLVTEDRKKGVPFILIQGGVAQTRRSVLRCGVDSLVRKAGAQAGVNGTFFADARVAGTDNVLIGPSLCGNEAQAVFNREDNAKALAGRPLVLLSPGRTRILPYDPEAMADQPALAARLPGLTDAFLGGVWLVHEGAAADGARLDGFHVHDAEDPRRRAFFALMPDGRLALGATTYVATSAELARALSAEGVQEAVLLDSGFSTSLVYGRKILVTGHTSPGIPSRPVPHALILFGKPGKRRVLTASDPTPGASADPSLLGKGEQSRGMKIPALLSCPSFPYPSFPYPSLAGRGRRLRRG